MLSGDLRDGQRLSARRPADDALSGRIQQNARVTSTRKKLSGLSIAVALVGALIQFALGAYYLGMAHAPHPHHLPVGLVAPAAQRAELVPPLEKGGAFNVADYRDVATLETAIKDRKAYGGLVIAPTGATLYVASAASPAVANLLKSLYTQEYERRLAASVKQATAAGAPVPAATAARLAAPPTIVDLVPLPAEDSAGSSLGFLIQALSLGASIASLALGRIGAKVVGRSARRGLGHAALLILYAVLSGAVALAAMSMFGVGRNGDHGGLFLAFSLISLAITASTAAAVALVGPAGALVGGLYFTLGLIISGSSIAPEMLPGAGRVIGQLLPPGAGATFIRDRLYFPNAPDGGQIAELLVFAGVGLLVILVRNTLAGRRASDA
jgi:hypothetical protein